jgi:hypothetical protein
MNRLDYCILETGSVIQLVIEIIHSVGENEKNLISTADTVILSSNRIKI